MRKSTYWLSRRYDNVSSVATDQHTGKRAHTGCLGGRIRCQIVATDLHT